MSRPSDVLLLLRSSSHSLKHLAQIFAQTITVGLIKTTSAWNCVIRAYAKSPTPVQAIFIYNHFMQLTSLLPDNHTYPALIKACSRLGSLPKGKAIHAILIKSCLDADFYAQNSLIHMYGIMGQLNDSRKLFEEMPQRDLVTWNSFLAAYVAATGMRHEALVIFKGMVLDGVGADEITLITLLTACSQLRFLYYGKNIHAYGLKNGIVFTRNLDNALLDLYAKGGDMETAFRVFTLMGPRDIVSHTILINGYVELGLVDVARVIFDQMLVKDLVLWNSLIGGYVKAKRPKEALELFERMKTEMIEPDEFTIVSVLSACGNLSDLRFGRLVHSFTKRKNIKIDAFVETALLDMYAKCGSLEDAVCTFYKMKYKDVFAWTTVIMGLANYGLGEEALSFFLQMQREGIKPNGATFVAVLTACSRSGLVDEGCHWFDQMMEFYKIPPNVEHLGCMIDMLSRADLLYQAMELIRAIPGEDKVISYKALLNACISYADLGVGEKVANELSKLDPKSHGICILLSNFYALAGRWDDVVKMRRIMKEHNLKKVVGFSLIEEKA